MPNSEAYYAYDAGLPCKNPACKSHGQPHPNCRCYGAHAEGGNVDHFCSENRAHDTSCQYFADGGDASLGFVPDEQPQDTSAPQQASPEPASDDLGFVPDAHQSSQDDLGFVPDNSKYETAGQQALTVGEGVAQGALGPIATGLELGAHKLGLDSMLGIDTSAEAQAARQEANPGEHGFSEAAGLIGSTLVPVLGEYSVGVKAAEAANATAKLAGLGKLGSAALKGAVTSGLIQGGDELSKYLIGQNTDPTAAVASVLAGGALGGIAGGLFNISGNKVSKGLEDLENNKMGSKALNYLGGIAVEANPSAIMRAENLSAATNFDSKEFDAGAIAYRDLLKSMIVPGSLGTLQGIEGYRSGGISGGLKGAAAGVAEGMLARFGIKQVNKLTAPIIFNLLQSGQVDKLATALNNAKSMQKGITAISNGVENLFKTSTQQGVNAVATEVEKQKLHQFMKEGGLESQIQKQLQPQGSLVENGSYVPSNNDAINSGDTTLQGFHGGGEVSSFSRASLDTTSPAIAGATTKLSTPFNNATSTNESKKLMVDSPYNHYTMNKSLSKPVREALNKPETSSLDSMAQHYPAVGMMLGTAKGRINNYLNSQRPQDDQSKLAFDAPTSQTVQKKSYDKALGMAVQPLSVLNHIKEGTLGVEHMQHFSAMYPELYSHLQNKITEKITQAQLNGEKPSYRVRQGLSLFMGTPLDGTLTPQNIQAAQAVYTQQAAQLQAQPGQTSKPKKNTSKLSKVADDYRTGDQAAAARSQNGS